MFNGHVLIFEDLNLFLAKLSGTSAYSQVIVLVDEHTEKCCLPIIENTLPKPTIIAVPSGEENKNIQTCLSIWDKMTAAKADRKSLVLNLGGGVIGDMGGFCAATYKRGIDFIQIPTTLLSMVDASVGGKLGIDFQEFKNHIGVFKIPAAVLIYPGFLQTLDPRELRSGFAEIIKHCLIADAQKWEEIKEKDWKTLSYPDLVRHSVSIKSNVVTQDPEEKGLRKILNFGHTLGHAIESFYLPQKNKKLLHGEAIAIGMIVETWLSYLKGFLSLQASQDVKNYILGIYPKVTIPPSDFDSIISLTYQDKKNEGDRVLFSLLKKIGEANYNIPIHEEEMKAALAYYAE